MSNRPDWASGPEWDGWRMVIGHIRRTTERRTGMEISKDGWLWVGSALLYLPDPAAALRVANVIAEELGGWAK